MFCTNFTQTINIKNNPKVINAESIFFLISCFGKLKTTHLKGLFQGLLKY